MGVQEKKVELFFNVSSIKEKNSLPRGKDYVWDILQLFVFGFSQKSGSEVVHRRKF